LSKEDGQWTWDSAVEFSPDYHQILDYYRCTEELHKFDYLITTVLMNEKK